MTRRIITVVHAISYVFLSIKLFIGQTVVFCGMETLYIVRKEALYYKLVRLLPIYEISM